MVLHKLTKRRERKNSRAKDTKNSARAQTETEANRKLWVDPATLPQMKQYNTSTVDTQNRCGSPDTKGNYLERETRSSKQETKQTPLFIEVSVF
jgi:hypothetical protein